QKVNGRTDALSVQDEAAQFCTVSYRAPELFDVGSDALLDARTDVWSLGCLLFALGFGFSPFECEFGPHGEVRVVECSFLRVIGQVTFPSKVNFSKGFCDLILLALNQDPSKRVYVDELLECTLS
ncbi:unnamed protein product, partial [Choristocarpus tenellus]